MNPFSEIVVLGSVSEETQGGELRECTDPGCAPVGELSRTI